MAACRHHAQSIKDLCIKTSRLGGAVTDQWLLAARVLPHAQLERPDARPRHPATVAVVGARLKDVFHQPALYPKKASHSVVKDCTPAWVLEWLSVVVQSCMPRTAELESLRVAVCMPAVESETKA